MNLHPRIVRWLDRRASKLIHFTKPDFIIGDRDNPYMHRWYLIPRNRFANIYLHFILRSDDDRALHDHPWPSISVMLDGDLGEWYRADGGDAFRSIRPGRVVFRPASFAHRLVVPATSYAVTLFITGPKIREWGFWCPQGFRHWREYSQPHDAGKIGRGCD